MQQSVLYEQRTCPHCQDGGVAPFYLIEELHEGAPTGRIAVLCHTCKHSGKPAIFQDTQSREPDKPADNGAAPTTGKVRR